MCVQERETGNAHGPDAMKQVVVHIIIGKALVNVIEKAYLVVMLIITQAVVLIAHAVECLHSCIIIGQALLIAKAIQRCSSWGGLHCTIDLLSGTPSRLVKKKEVVNRTAQLTWWRAVFPKMFLISGSAPLLSSSCARKEPSLRACSSSQFTG